MNREVRLYNGFQFFFTLLPWVPIFYEYQRRAGLTDAEIFSIQSVYYVAFCLLEIPTGLVADLWGHRRCMKLGALCLIAAHGPPIVWPTYAGFLVHFLLVAVARSFISGASSAYLYEFLDAQASRDEFQRAEGRARAISLVGKVACWAAIGWLMQWRATSPYWIGAASAVAALASAARLPARSGGDRVLPGLGEAGAQLLDNLGAVGKLLRASPMLVFLMLQGVGIFVLARICQVNLFQPILESKSIGVGSYGMVMAAVTLFEALGSARPGWVRRRWSDLDAVFLLTVVMAASLLCVPWLGATATLGSLCLFFLATGFSYPIQRQLINDAIPDSRFRATVMSLESIVDRAVCAAVAWLLGRAMSAGSLDRFLVGSSVVALAAMAVLFAVLRRGGLRALAAAAAKTGAPAD